MTNTELKKKYPVNTKIKWTLSMSLANSDAKKDVGKTGIIVGYSKDNNPFIFLFGSNHKASNSTQRIPISWWSTWEDVEVLSRKNEQLLFDFAYEV